MRPLTTRSPQRLVYLIALLALLSCPSSPSAEGPGKEEHSKGQEYPDAAAEAEANNPGPGLASIYVLRPRAIVGVAGCFGLMIDGFNWGSLNNGQFAWDPIRPGVHSLGRAKADEFSLQVESGKTYYVQISAGGFGSGGVKFLPAEEGEKMRRALKLNPDRWLLHQYLSNWDKVRVGMRIGEVEKLLTFAGMSSQTFSYRLANASETSNNRKLNGIAVMPVETEKVFRSDVLWYVLIFKSDILIGKTGREVFRDTGQTVNLTDYRGTVDGVPYWGGILGANGGVLPVHLGPYDLPCGWSSWDGTNDSPSGRPGHHL